MLNRLVSVRVLAHVHHLHFPHLVNHGTALQSLCTGNEKYGVEHAGERLFTPHQVDQSLWIVKNRPGVVPAVALREIAAPGRRIKFRRKGAVVGTTRHQLVLRIEEVFVVHCPFAVNGYFRLRLAQGFSEAIDGPVVVGIFQSTGHILTDAHVIGDITILVIFGVAGTSRCRHRGMHAVRPMFERFPECFGIVSPQSLYVSVSDYRSRIVSHHDIPVARAGPLRKKAALFVGIDQSLLHLHVLGGIDEIEKGKEASECIPEAGIGEHVAGKHFPVVWTVVIDIAIGIDLRKVPGEEYRAIKIGIKGTDVVDVVIFNLDSAKYFIPACFALLHDPLERVVSQFAQIQQRLCLTDKGGRHVGMHLLVVGGVKTDHRTGMVSGVN